MYSRTEIVESGLNMMMGEFKKENYIRKRELNFFSEFADVMSYTTSTKRDKEYTLFRGLKSSNAEAFTGAKYNDVFPSSWSTRQVVAERFASAKGIIICTTVSSSAVMFDYEYVYGYDSEYEVVLVLGSYKYTYVKREEKKEKEKTKEELQLALFTLAHFFCACCGS
jgi:hypothetical protein